MSAGTIVEFFVPAEPRAQGRVRFAARDRQGNALPFGRKYVDAQTENVRALLATFAAKHRPVNLFEGPIKFTMVVLLLKPRSYSKARWAWDTKPDCDNFSKLKDAFNGILWRDDAQIVEEHIFKVQNDRLQGFYVKAEEAQDHAEELMPRGDTD